MEFSSEQQYEAYRALPRPLREYLVSAEYGNIVTSLGAKYGLHIDTTGQLSLLTGYMLSGLINPIQFQQELQRLGIPNAASASIINDLNEQVFKPLQEKVRNAAPEEPEREESPAEPVPVAQQPAPVTAYAVPTPPAPGATASAYVPPTPRVPAEPLVPPPSIAPRPVPAPMQYSPVMPPPITPEPRTVQAPPPAPQPTPIYSQPAPAPMPAYQPPPMPAPRPAAPPPANLPGANGPVPEWSGYSAMPAPMPASAAPQGPVSTGPTVPQTPAPKPARNDALHDVMKNYGVDPYREPPE